MRQPCAVASVVAMASAYVLDACVLMIRAALDSLPYRLPDPLTRLAVQPRLDVSRLRQSLSLVPDYPAYCG